MRVRRKRLLSVAVGLSFIVVGLLAAMIVFLLTRGGPASEEELEDAVTVDTTPIVEDPFAGLEAVAIGQVHATPVVLADGTSTTLQGRSNPECCRSRLSSSRS